MKVTDFKVGDRVKVVKNSCAGYWQPGYTGELTIQKIGKSPSKKSIYVTVLGKHKSEAEVSDFTQQYDSTDLELVEHPNQKLANEVAEILRDAADEYLAHPKGKFNPGKYTYSCTSAGKGARIKGWSSEKINRVMARYLRSIGVDPGSFYCIPSEWSEQKRQETRHAWLYIAAQFAEENPDLVPTYGKKKVEV